MRDDLPTGIVTLLLTDIEGSTRMIHEIGEDGYVEALAEHRRRLRSAFSNHGGVEVDTQGDAFLYAFADPVEALAAAEEGQQALASGPVKVRMGLHTAELLLTGEGYAGRELHRAARIASSGHGGQVVLSISTRALVDGDLTELGEHRLKDFDEPTALFQVGRERPSVEHDLEHQPAAAGIVLRRPGSRTRGAPRPPRERHPAGHALRSGRLGEDAPGDRSRVRAHPSLQGGRLLGRPRAAARLRARRRDDRADTGREGWPRRPHRRARAPAPARQLRAGGGGGVGHLAVARDLPEPAAPRHESGTPADPREVDYPVPPLAEPEGVELFCDRSRLDPDEPIHELCRRLDDLPLAVELAAARTRVLTPSQILDRLGHRLDLFEGGRDADPRQRTLRATLGWSYDLLTDDEKELFARLAVFAGGCTLEAAEEVCEARLDVLQSLVEKSLLRHTGDRFWMLETIREFAAERLEAAGGSKALRAAHAGFFASFAERAAPEIEYGGDQREWANRMAAEYDNIRSAVGFGLDEAPEIALRIIGGVAFFVWLRGGFAEVRTWVDEVLAVGADVSPKLRGRALISGALVASLQGDAKAATRYADEAFAQATAAGDGFGITSALRERAKAAHEAGDFDRARASLEELVVVADEVGDPGTARSRSTTSVTSPSMTVTGRGRSSSADEAPSSDAASGTSGGRALPLQRGNRAAPSRTARRRCTKSSPGTRGQSRRRRQDDLRLLFRSRSLARCRYGSALGGRQAARRTRSAEGGARHESR